MNIVESDIKRIAVIKRKARSFVT